MEQIKIDVVKQWLINRKEFSALEVIETLEKENEELKKKSDTNHSLVEQLANKDIEIAELKEQIEKMKCCDNCKHLGIFYDEELGTIANCVYLVECQDGYNKWELKE